MKPGRCDCGTRDDAHYRGCGAIYDPHKPDGTRLVSCPSQCGDEHYVADARETAALWHGGQASALYAFVSTGTVLEGLSAEAEACRAMIGKRDARTGWGSVLPLTDDDERACNIMADICAVLEAELPAPTRLDERD